MVAALCYKLIALMTVIFSYKHTPNISSTKFDVRSANVSVSPMTFPIDAHGDGNAYDSTFGSVSSEGADGVDCASPEYEDDASSTDSAGSADGGHDMGNAYAGEKPHGDGNAYDSTFGGVSSEGADGVDCASPEYEDDASSTDSAGSADGGHDTGNAYAGEKRGIGQSSIKYEHKVFVVAFLFVLIQSVLHAVGRPLTPAYLAPLYNNLLAKFYVVASMFLAVGMYLVLTLDCEGMYHYVARCYMVYSLTFLCLLQNYSCHPIWLCHFTGAQILTVFLLSVSFTIVMLEFRNTCDAILPVVSVCLATYSPMYKLVRFFVCDPPTAMSESQEDSD